MLLYRRRHSRNTVQCHQTGGPIAGWAYNRNFKVFVKKVLFSAQKARF